MTEDLDAIRRVLSKGRSISELIRETSSNLASTTLMRRDNFLKNMPKRIFVKISRVSNIFSERLFYEDTLKKSIVSAKTDATLVTYRSGDQGDQGIQEPASTHKRKTVPVYASDLPNKRTVRLRTSVDSRQAPSPLRARRFSPGKARLEGIELIVFRSCRVL
jgi:hypothetical protein